MGALVPERPRQRPPTVAALSGLAFSGANGAPASPSGNDGILTAEELAALDLSSVAWAVLSACDSGVGEIRSEGVFGLKRALARAGARTSIVSLWGVDDAVASRFMRALYEERFLRKAGTAEAMRAAKLELLRRRRAARLSTHPFFWSGFVASGDWR